MSVMTSPLVSSYRQSAFQLDPLFRRCLGVAGGMAVVFLVAVILAPRRPVTIQSVDQVPERLAKLILEKKATPPPPVVKPKAQDLAQAKPEIEKAKPVEVKKPKPIRESTGARRAEPRADVNQGTAGRARAEAEVAQQLADVSSSLNSVLADLSTTLSAGQGSRDVSQSKRPQKGAVRSGRSGAEIASVPGSPPSGDNPKATSSKVSGTMFDIGSIRQVGGAGGGGSGGGTGGGGRAGGRRGAASAGAAGTTGSELRSDASLLAIVRKYSAGIRFCYDTQLKSDPMLRGRLIVSITVAASGAVSSAKIVESTLNSEAMHSCALAQIKSWKFGSIPEGDVTFQAPFMFTPPE